MKRIALLVLAGSIAILAKAGDPSPSASSLTAAQIVEKNVAARGGLDAWRRIQTMAWIGRIESAQAPAASLPFVLQMKRPNKTRFEVEVRNQRSLRIYDGTQGWKLHASPSGYPDLKPFSALELSYARDGQVIDGPLMDYAAKGIAVRLDGSDQIEGRRAYRLNVMLPSGINHRVWVDAQTFLEVKSDRASSNAFGTAGRVEVFYRNYRMLDGLQIPFTVESGSAAAKTTDRMVIDMILLNPPLDDDLFAKPKVTRQRGTVSATDTAAHAGRPVIRTPSSLRHERESMAPGLQAPGG